jgi:hypothetical protein
MTDQIQQIQTERRPTRQRAAIADALDGSPEFRSAQDIHAAMAGSGTKVGLATVYRNLQAMAAEGELDVIRTAEGEAVYRSCATARPPPPRRVPLVRSRGRGHRGRRRALGRGGRRGQRVHPGAAHRRDRRPLRRLLEG